MGRSPKEPPTEFTLAIHEELRAWCGRRNISYRALAEKAGLSRERVRKTISADEVALDTNELDHICVALSISPDLVIDNSVRTMEIRSGYRLAAFTSSDEKGVDEIID